MQFQTETCSCKPALCNDDVTFAKCKFGRPFRGNKINLALNDRSKFAAVKDIIIIIMIDNIYKAHFGIETSSQSCINQQQLTVIIAALTMQ